MSKRRQKSVMVSTRLLISLFQGPGECVAIRLDHPKLPDDARVVAVSHEWSRQVILALVESASFEEVPDGAQIPLFDDGGCLAECTLRYIDGDKVTESRPIQTAAAKRWRESEIRAASVLLKRAPADPALQMQLANADAALQRPIENEVCHPYKRLSAPRQLSRADIDAAKQTLPRQQFEEIIAKLEVPAELLEGDNSFSAATHESSREWFQRIMSQPD